jgi:glycosyltransferase involved in cell wall biosynthesis
MYQYLDRLAASGIDVTAAPLFSDADLARRYASGGYGWRAAASATARRLRALRGRRRYDALWVEYELLPFAPALVERLVSAGGPPQVVEYDDAVFHRYDRHRLPLVRGLLGRKIDRVMQRATIVVAGNEYLAARARAAGAGEVVVIPSVVDIDAYPIAPPPADREPVIGWIGSPSTEGSIDTVAGALARVCERTGARVVLVGARPDRRDWPFPCEVRPWVPGREAAEIATFTLGIMPLADDPWSRGKCGYKLVQYLACGRPAVASPVGANREIVLPDVTGLLATDEEDWVRALERLIGDGALRERLGRGARAHIEARYTIQRTAPVVAGVLHRAATGGTRSCAA